MNAVIRFGGISADGKCTEAIKISAKDAHHRIVMEEDGDREGWTSVYTPGRFLVDANTNKNLKPGNAPKPKTEAFYYVSKISPGSNRFSVTVQNRDYDLKNLKIIPREPTNDIRVIDFESEDNF